MSPFQPFKGMFAHRFAIFAFPPKTAHAIESVTFNFGFQGNVDGVPAKFLVSRGVHRLQIFLYLLCSAKLCRQLVSSVEPSCATTDPKHQITSQSPVVKRPLVSYRDHFLPGRWRFYNFPYSFTLLYLNDHLTHARMSCTTPLTIRRLTLSDNLELLIS